MKTLKNGSTVVQMMIWVEPDLKEDLRKEAAKHRMSLTQYVLKCLEERHSSSTKP